MLMDNGQHRQNLQDPFATSITSGVGAAPEIANPSQDNLNAGIFEERNYAGIGNAALNAPMMPPDANLEADLPLEEAPGQQLGQITNLPDSPMPNMPPKAPKKPEKPEEPAVDPAILEHFGDGKIDRNDITYLREKENELEPSDLNKFVSELRKVMIDSSKVAK